MKKNSKKQAKKRARSRVTKASTLGYSVIQPVTWVAAAAFKAQCLELMNKVNERHMSVVITKHGQPVAKLVPFQDEPADIVGFMKGTVLSHGDLISPIDEPWDADG